MQSVGYECRVMVFRAIDNDLWGTDHCPGYGSAEYIATSIMEVYHMPGLHKGQITVLKSWKERRLADSFGCPCGVCRLRPD